jgi:2-hydroxy-3-keto-5-methylthiopentenyl-1-phosphate phosphatase
MNRIVSTKAAKQARPEPACPSKFLAGVSYQVWLDFDGTITRQDVIDELLGRYSINDSWKAVEHRWQDGLIGSRQCLEEQLDVVRISQGELDNLLNGIELDKGIFSLLLLLSEFEVPAAILSDGIDVFIRSILQRQGIHNIPIRSNTMVRSGSGIKFCCPYSNPECDCKAAHCKCASIKAIGDPGRKSIYIGDGLSDLCAAQKADLVFAKGALAESLEKRGIKFIRYSNLNEVVKVLRNIWSVQESALESQASSRTMAK